MNIHFCPSCGHSFNDNGVLADGGYGCISAMVEIPITEWRWKVLKTKASITKAGRRALEDEQS